MVSKILAEDLRKKTMEELREQLSFAELEYQRSLQEKHSRSIEPEDLRTARKNITRCKHIIQEKRLEKLVEEFKGKRFIPKELRPKLNKNLRMKLTDKQKGRNVTRRQQPNTSKPRVRIFSYKE